MGVKLIQVSGDKQAKINVFTTRPDTIFGASFIALSVDHPLNKKYISILDSKFKEQCDKFGTTEEALANAEKLGFKTDLYVDHPFIQEKEFRFILPTLY